LDDDLFSALNEFLFSQFAKFTTNAKETTVHDPQSLGKSSLCFETFKRVPQALPAEHKKTRLELAGQGRQRLSSARIQEWDSFLTGDESWFDLNTDAQRMWLHRIAARRARENKLCPRLLVPESVTAD
jgi:hypothetical protein